MKLSELQNIENELSAGQDTTLSNFKQMLLNEFLEKETRKQKSGLNPFEYYYEDIISFKMEFDFQPAIGNKIYLNASEDALSCLNICNDFHRISSWLIAGWVNNALKFTDHIVLHYIQNQCKLKPVKYPKTGIEKSRYMQLSKSESREMSIAGSQLITLYELRNDLEHRTRINADGTQELIPPKRGKVRKTVVKLYPEILKQILKVYKSRSISKL